MKVYKIVAFASLDRNGLIRSEKSKAGSTAVCGDRANKRSHRIGN